MPRPTTSPSRRWARRVHPERIRALYRSEERGLLDAELTSEVGWALWARARDVLEVSHAVHTGDVTCPQCGATARRQRRQAQGPEVLRPVRCETCGYSADWRAVKEYLKTHPICLDCLVPLVHEYAEGRVACPRCGSDGTLQEYRRRLRGRRRVPCPGCHTVLREPPTDRDPRPAQEDAGAPMDDEAAVCVQCGASYRWRALRAACREDPHCVCGGRLVAETQGLHCTQCGRLEPRSQFSRRLARRRTGPCPGCGHTVRRPADSVQCGACGWEGPWSAFRRAWQGQALLTGVGLPACRQFLAEWPRCRASGAQMPAVDGFLHALHDGPLAPLFIAGSKASVLALLDELAGATRRLRQDA